MRSSIVNTNNAPLTLCSAQELPLNLSTSAISQSIQYPEEKLLLDFETSIKKINFFSALQQEVKIPLQPLSQILSIMASEENEIIKQALYKKNGFVYRFFSHESWQEWTENQTALGKVTTALSHFLNSNEISATKYLANLNTEIIETANQQAIEILHKLNYINLENSSNLFDSISLQTTGISLLSSMTTRFSMYILAIQMGAQPKQIALMNILDVLIHANSVSSVRAKVTVDTGDTLKELHKVGTVFIKNFNEGIEKTISGSIEKAQDATAETILDLYQYGKLFIRDIGDETQVRADEIFANAFTGSEVVIKLASAELRAVIKEANTGVDATLALLPRIAGESARQFINNLFNSLKKATFGNSELDNVKHNILNSISVMQDNIDIYQRGSTDSYKRIFYDILNSVYSQSQKGLTAKDKENLYKLLITTANKFEIELTDRKKMMLSIGVKAYTDDRLKTPTISGWFSTDDTDPLKEVIDAIPEEDVRELLSMQLRSGSREFTSSFKAEMRKFLNQLNSKTEHLQGHHDKDAIPSGAIMAFDLEKCPEGWQEFEPAQGRFLLGKSDKYPLGTTGGKETHTLTKNELPSWEVKSGEPGLIRKTLHGEKKTIKDAIDDIDSGEQPDLISSPTGKLGNDKAFSIMPPYFALMFCKKINSKEKMEHKIDDIQLESHKIFI